MAAVSSLILGGLILGKTVLDATSQHKAAKSAQKMGEYEGSMYDQAARDAIARGEETVHHVASDARLLTGSQRAALAASGVAIDSGSAADVIANDQRRAVLDEQQARVNASREAFGFTEQARLARMGGRNQAQAYTNQMYSTLIGGATDLYDRYRAFGLNRARPDRSPPQFGAIPGGYHSGTAGY
jgi:flavin-binding protein dodecin